MTRRFVIGIDGLTSEQKSELTTYLSKYGRWWHWINNLWLFVSQNNDITTSLILKKIAVINPSIRAMVMEIPEDITWSVRGSPNAEGTKIGDWLKTEWVAGQADE